MSNYQTRVLRFEIPVDDRPHGIPDGLPLMAHPWRSATELPAGLVELWIETRAPETSPTRQTRQAQVFGTGHIIPDGASWLGSCLDGPLVWHVYDVTGVQ